MLPPPPAAAVPDPGRQPITNRQTLTGPASLLPKETGCGSGVSCRRRLGDWQAAGDWEKIDAIPKIGSKPGAPGFRPARSWPTGVRRIVAWLPERGTDVDRHLGVFRGVDERTLAWLHQFRRLRVRYERRADVHQAFLTLGRIVICHRYLAASI